MKRLNFNHSLEDAEPGEVVLDNRYDSLQQVRIAPRHRTQIFEDVKEITTSSVAEFRRVYLIDQTGTVVRAWERIK